MVMVEKKKAAKQNKTKSRSTRKSGSSVSNIGGGSTIYGFGIAGLILAAAVELILAIIMFGSTNNFGVGLLVMFLFLGAILFFPLFWLIVGIVCLVKSGKAPSEYRTKLRVVGVLNLLNVVMLPAVFVTYFVFVVWVYWAIVFGWLMRNSKMTNEATKNNRIKKRELIQDQASYRVLVVIALVVVAIVLLFGMIATVSR